MRDYRWEEGPAAFRGRERKVLPGEAASILQALGCHLDPESATCHPAFHAPVAHQGCVWGQGCWVLHATEAGCFLLQQSVQPPPLARRRLLSSLRLEPLARLGRTRLRQSTGSHRPRTPKYQPGIKEQRALSLGSKSELSNLRS